MLPDNVSQHRFSTQAAPSTRRAFLQSAGKGIAAGALAGGIEYLSPATRSWGAESTPDAATLIAGKDSRLVVHNAKTAEFETPLALLREHAITPKEILFVRNNQELEGTRTIKPRSAEGWRVEFVGQVEYPRTISADKLAELPQTEVEMVLQCSGNGRSSFPKQPGVSGTPWRHGAMGNVRFRGPSLKSVMEALDLKVSPAAAFVTAEGKDGPPSPEQADFEHSVPLADALARGLLALELNGEPLAAAHGGPVRFVMPGYYGTMNVKWASRLRLETRETFNHHQRRRYRTPFDPIKPGSEFVYDFNTSDPNWRMRIKSVVFSPLDGETVSAKTAVQGVAFNDGSAKIEAVELSVDGGRSWRRAKLETPGSPYAWHHWHADLQLERGSQQIMARAVDALGRTQPLDGSIGWNPAGYCWSGVQTVQVNVR